MQLLLQCRINDFIKLFAEQNRNFTHYNKTAVEVSTTVHCLFIMLFCS